jgi:small conductance mechanosensitive channel
MEKFINSLPIDLEHIISSLIVILVAILFYQILRYPAKRILGLQKNKKSNTYMSMISSFVRTAYITIVILILLQINGVDVYSLIAGVGIASVVIGLAVQDTLKDIIRGISILSEDYFKIGDYVTINGNSGTVIHTGIRSTKIKDGLTGNIISIANRNIETAEVGATAMSIDIPLPYELKLEKAEAILNEIVESSRELEYVNELNYKGVNEFGDSAIIYRIFGKSEKGKRIDAKRAILRQALVVLEKHNISVPYPQMDVHQKKD